MAPLSRRDRVAAALARWSLVLGGAAVLLAAGCGMQGVRPTPARLKVVAVPPEATVYVDDRFVAAARVLERRPRELEPGGHLVTIRAPGYFPHDLEVDLPRGLTTIEIELRPIPP